MWDGGIEIAPHHRSVGYGVEVVPNLPSVGYRYLVRTEPYRNVRLGIDAVSNLTEDCGRVFTEQISPVYFGTYFTLSNVLLNILLFFTINTPVLPRKSNTWDVFAHLCHAW